MSVFNDPEVVRLLSAKFVPVATMTGARDSGETEFFSKVFKGYGNTNGVVITAEGERIAGLTAFRPKMAKAELEAALAKFQPPETPLDLGPAPPVDPKHVFQVPEGGLVAMVITRGLPTRRGVGEYETVRQLLHERKMVGLDRLWIRKDEAEQLAGGTFPDSLKWRIAKYHMEDTTVCGTSCWVPANIKQFDLALADGRMTGSIHHEAGGRVYDGDMLGVVETTEDRVTRFDLLVKGTFRYSDGYDYPMSVAFTLADENNELSKVPPYVATIAPYYLD